jgi:hypothetical protein
MKRVHLFLLVLALVLVLQLTGCAKSPEAPAGAGAAEEVLPATIEHMDGPQPTQITLTEDAARRIDVHTDAVQIQMVGGNEETVIPYASIIYDTEGNTWVYTNPQALTYVRTPVTVRTIQGDDAVIESGLDSGTAVVTVGAEELFGSETEFEEE